MTTMSERPTNAFGPTLSRRQFVKTGGALVVGFKLIGPGLLRVDASKPVLFKNSLDPTLASSWIEIHPDNTILIRTGKSDFGQGSTFTAYRQIVAEELSLPFEAVTTVVQGDTDRTPDGGGAFDYLGQGTPNLRKVAAYTYQAMLDLASERLGVPKDKLSVENGAVSGDLTGIVGFSVTGNPPMKPVSQYKVVGKSYPNSIIASKVAAKETWAT